MDINRPIHWYPGHMAVATKDIQKNLKLVDMIIELIDARAPISSRHPFLAQYNGNKGRLIVMAKTDLADPIVTSRWEIYFKERQLPLLALNLFDRQAPGQIIEKALEISAPIHAKQIAKGMKPQPIRALVIGIPNVGKSTLINRIAKHTVAQVADRPGVTRAPQWIKPNDRIWLLDTPGVLPMNYDLKLTALHLAAIGAIKRDILPLDAIAAFLHQYIRGNYPKMLDRYLGFESSKDFHQFMEQLGDRFLIKEMNQAIERFYDDFRTGIIGRITLEVVY